MKLLTNIKVNQGNLLVMEVLNNQHFLSTLDPTKTYTCELKEKNSQRSIEQNKLLWKNIQAISKALTQDILKTYCDMLEKADVKSDFIIATSMEMGVALKKSFRGSLFIKPVNVNGKEGYLFKVYLGSSTFNTKEMTELISITLDMMSELGIYEVDYE
jgi:hypothetical protein